LDDAVCDVAPPVDGAGRSRDSMTPDRADWLDYEELMRDHKSHSPLPGPPVRTMRRADTVTKEETC